MLGEQTVLKSKLELSKPKLYAVIIYNDNVTTMEFVVEILNKVFNKSLSEATKLMLEVHEKGKGIAGIYLYDIAATKKNQADTIAIKNNFPLKIIIEEYGICI